MPPTIDPGSFRDHDGRVFQSAGRIYRALSASGLESWRAVEASRFFPRLVAKGRVVTTSTCDGATPLAELEGDWAGCLEHEALPLQSYPYEWSFEMLKDAALLQLDILAAALEEGFTLKDATPYNTLFRGSRPVFIDIGSFEPWTPGEPWIGYSQFCQLFLYPLLLCAYRDISFQGLLRGALDGIEPGEASRILSSWRDRTRPGVFRDVFLLAKLQHRTADSSTSARSQLRDVGFGKELILANVRRLRKVISGLAWSRSESEWATYAESNRYDEAERQRKEQFVLTAAGRKRPHIVWDLGANTGHYSRLVAPEADWVVAMEGDHLAADLLYRRLRADGPANVLPMVVDLADPSPALGWRHRERRALDQRQRPDLTLSLALIHHLVLTANVPLPDFVDWLASLGGRAVVEWVEPSDPMVLKLLKNKGGEHHRYDRELFEEAVRARFEVVDRLELLAGQRVLYSCLPHSHA